MSPGRESARAIRAERSRAGHPIDESHGRHQQRFWTRNDSFGVGIIVRTESVPDLAFASGTLLPPIHDSMGRVADCDGSQEYNQPMCGRYTLRELDLLRQGLGFESRPDFEEFSEHVDPRQLFNMGPGNKWPIIRLDKNDKPVISLVKWGFIPFYTKGQPTLQPINAKGETAATSGMFREAFKRRRCLVPADGFYEPKGPKKLKYRPWFFFQKPDASMFTFGGVWDRWKPTPEAEPLDTFAIITTPPNEMVGEIHDRSPLVIEPKDHARWLARDADVADLLKPFGEDMLEMWPVSDAAKSQRNVGPELIKPLDGF